MAVQLDTGMVLTPEQEQQKWLTEAVHAATTKAASMNAAIAERNTLAVLSHASQMLAELRTGMLTPQYYYELYMRVFNEITPLQEYFLEEVRSGRQTPEGLYATVQHAGNIVPRLMLLITIGSVYIQCKAAPAKDILGDLIEMVKGVQHPTRGLFVRHYLATLMKDKLPDVENEYEGVGGTVIDSATFILRNFKEMVWLWYRMETKSNIANKAKRDKERRDLRLLIGLNLRRLSDLSGLDKAMYVERILPVVLQIILEHQEPILQQYLTEVVVQVFPDEFHLATLRGLLDAASGLVTGVNVQSILCPLMDRLGKYVVALRDGTNETPASKKEEKTIAKMFGLFKEKLGEIVQSHNTQSFPPVAFAETASSLIKLTLRAYPDMVERVDEVLEVVYSYFSQAGIDDAASKTLRKMLEFVVEDIKQVNTVLDFQWYSKVIGLLGFQARRQVAMSLIDTAARLGAKVDTAERVGKLFDIISPLVKDVDDTPARKEDIYTISVADEFVEEQHVVCKALHLVDNEDAKDLSKLYSAIRRELGKGGTERLRYTMKAMASLYIRLALRCKKAEVNGGSAGANPEKLFNYIYTGDGGGILEHLATQAPIEGFYLYLHAANVADTCELHNNDTVGSLYGEAFKLYEESAGSTKQQLQMLNSLIGSLAALRSMPEDRYDVLATRLCQYSSRLVQKPDQSRMVMQCSHLFWKKALTEDLHRKTSECLTRSLKIADNCPSGLQFGLFAEALNHYSYYFNAQMPQVNATSLNAVISMNNDAITSTEDKNTEVFRAARRFFKNTASALKKRKDADDTWAEIEI